MCLMVTGNISRANNSYQEAFVPHTDVLLSIEFAPLKRKYFPLTEATIFGGLCCPVKQIREPKIKSGRKT